MKIKLVDHKVDTAEEVVWGTCELCEHIGPFDFAEFKFQASDGSDPYWVHGWYTIPYDGPYSAVDFRNVFDFAAWLSEKDFPEGTVLDTDLLSDLSYEYQEADFA